jgi:hypothetical protein
MIDEKKSKNIIISKLIGASKEYNEKEYQTKTRSK